MTTAMLPRMRHAIGIGLAAGIGLIIVILWVWVVPWIEQTSLADLSTLCFIVLAAAALSLGERLWTHFNPSH